MVSDTHKHRLDNPIVPSDLRFFKNVVIQYFAWVFVCSLGFFLGRRQKHKKRFICCRLLLLVGFG